jgi:uncharacterized protein (TIGR00369 family)
MSNDAAPAADTKRDNPFHALIGVELVAKGEGRARIRMPVTPRVAGGVHGSVHGGVLSALIDIAALYAIQTVVGPDQRMNGTAALNISYLRPALGEEVFANATVLKKGRTLAVVDVDLVDRNDRLLAKGRLDYSLRPLTNGTAAREG